MNDDYKEDQLKDSQYDGIQEYDNNLPRWWLRHIFSDAHFWYCLLGSFSCFSNREFPKQRVCARIQHFSKDVSKGIA